MTLAGLAQDWLVRRFQNLRYKEGGRLSALGMGRNFGRQVAEQRRQAAGGGGRSGGAALQPQPCQAH